LGAHDYALDLAPVMIRGVEGTITFWARGMERLYGFTEPEAVGHIAHLLW
jgi:PAS domain-containing protein